MVDKKQVRRRISQLQRIKTWQLIILLILASFVSATFLRLNNIGMVERRDAVYTADNAGDDKIIQSRLYDLQRHISAHMNTGMDNGVTLAATYNRDNQELLKKASNDTNSNGNIYKQVQEICAPKFSYWSQAYVQCVTDELGKYPAGHDLINSVKLPAEPYTHNFISPLWSPDFAGWSVLVCVVILIMIIARFIGVVILRILLRSHYKSI